MRYLVWVLRLLVFLVVLLFALKNTEPVKVSFFAEYALANVPLIVVMLVTFLLGLLFGLLLVVFSIMRKKREIAKLKRDVARLEDTVKNVSSSTESISAETIVPLAPL